MNDVKRWFGLLPDRKEKHVSKNRKNGRHIYRADLTQRIQEVLVIATGLMVGQRVGEIREVYFDLVEERMGNDFSKWSGASKSAVFNARLEAAKEVAGWMKINRISLVNDSKEDGYVRGSARITIEEVDVSEDKENTKKAFNRINQKMKEVGLPKNIKAKDLDIADAYE